MRRFFRWLGLGAGVIAVLALAATLYVWIAAGGIIERRYEPPATNFVFDAASADVDEGRRAALLRGCFDGCHGDGVAGSVFNDDWLFGKIVAPELTRAFAEMSDAELDRVVRHGVRRDGQSTWVMPSASFHHLSDPEFNNITAFIRSLERIDGPELDVRPGLLARYFIWQGTFRPQAQEILEDGPWLTEASTHGEYLALTICAECHQMDLQGFADFTPSLAAVVAYPLEDFRSFMRTGIALGGRELDLMSDMSRRRFSHFTDAEIDALHAYLQTLASDDPAPAGDSPAD